MSPVRRHVARRAHRRFHAWKINLEGRAAIQRAFGADVTIALLDDAVRGGQAESRSFADSLGRKERLENVLERLLIHADSGVLHTNARVSARARALVDARELLIEDNRIRTDSQLAATRHGLAGIHNDI